MNRTLDACPARIVRAMRDLRTRLDADWGEALLSLTLFGSQARGEAHADSDVDVCVVMREDTIDVRRRVIDTATDVEMEHGMVISPTVFDTDMYERWKRQERALVMDIEQDGIAI